MNYSSPIKTRPTHTVRRVHKRHRKAFSGRFYIFFLFLWLRAIDAATLYALYPRLAIVYKRYLILSLVTTSVWTTGLLLAIWFRQNWAKYVLVGSLLLTVISTLSMLPGLPDSVDPQKELCFIMGVTVVYLPVALFLMVSQSIHKLTREKRGKTFE